MLTDSRRDLWLYDRRHSAGRTTKKSHKKCLGACWDVCEDKNHLIRESKHCFQNQTRKDQRAGTTFSPVRSIFLDLYFRVRVMILDLGWWCVGLLIRGAWTPGGEVVNQQQRAERWNQCEVITVHSVRGGWRLTAVQDYCRHSEHSEQHSAVTLTHLILEMDCLRSKSGLTRNTQPPPHHHHPHPPLLTLIYSLQLHSHTTTTDQVRCVSRAFNSDRRSGKRRI